MNAPPLRTLVVDDEPLPRERVVTLVREASGLELVGEAASGPEALDQIVALRPDLVFLDIQLPDMDAFEVVDALGSTAAEAADGAVPAIVFVTAYDEYAVRAFEVDAVDYLLKPVSAERFAATVERVRERLARAERPGADQLLETVRRLDERREPRRRFVVRRGTRHSFVSVEEVDWIAADGNYVRLHAGGRTHLVRGTMNAVESELAGADFVRIHRSTLVNLARVATIQASGEGEYLVTMRDGTRLASSRGYSHRLRTLLS